MFKGKTKVVLKVWAFVCCKKINKKSTFLYDSMEKVCSEQVDSTNLFNAIRIV